MKKILLFACPVFLAAAVPLLFQPLSLHAQEPLTDEAQLTLLVSEIALQNAQLVENQKKIQEKMALLEEELRQARIYASRAGKKGASN